MLDEVLAGRIAERAAVGALTGLGSKIAETVAKEAIEGVHGSPITDRGKAILGEPPLCYSFRGCRSWVLTRAWKVMEETKSPRLDISGAWSDLRRICAMSPEMVEAKKPELCSLPYMEQIPACERYLAKEEVLAGV